MLRKGMIATGPEGSSQSWPSRRILEAKAGVSVDVWKQELMLARGCCLLTSEVRISEFYLGLAPH